MNTIGNPHTIDSITKYGLVDTGASGTYLGPDDPHENSHKHGNIVYVLSEWGN